MAMPGLASIRGGYSRQEATTRLKANIFGLVFTWVIYNLFSPFLIFHRMSETISGEAATWYIETLPYALFIFNSVIAGFSLYRPRKEAPVVGNVKYTSFKPSSPLTRAYSPIPKDLPAPSLLAKANPSSTSTSLQTSLSSSQLSNRYATPTRSGPGAAQLTPGSAHRSSPLSASTAKVLNLPRDSTPTRGALFFDQPGNGVGQPGAAAFSALNKDEMEWADNVWKGVRGKSGRL